MESSLVPFVILFCLCVRSVLCHLFGDSYLLHTWPRPETTECGSLSPPNPSTIAVVVVCPFGRYRARFVVGEWWSKFLSLHGDPFTGTLSNVNNALLETVFEIPNVE